jgi:membrane-bound lytic murein transglycosylase MltF
LFNKTAPKVSFFAPFCHFPELAVCGITLTQERKRLALLPPGNETLRDYVNGFIIRAQKSGLLNRLKAAYLHNEEKK